MKNTKQKKAFTLTELLVVVVIIGVLAAVVLPKFNKVIETRKTTEAEEIMAAVRTEQEYRCALDKPYIEDITKLSQIIPEVDTKHFTYSLESTGMLASSKGKYSYDLKMPSYADGRICCDGDECDKLNKDYPSCDTLTNMADFQEATACAIDIPKPEEFTDLKPAIPCGEAEIMEECPQGCGWKTREPLKCVNGNWTYTDWNTSACRAAKSKTEPCPEDSERVLTFTEVCDNNTGTWTYEGVEGVGECRSCGSKPGQEPEEISCTPTKYLSQPEYLNCGKQARKYSCGSDTNFEWQIVPDGECQETSDCKPKSCELGEWSVAEGTDPICSMVKYCVPEYEIDDEGDIVIDEDENYVIKSTSWAIADLHEGYPQVPLGWWIGANSDLAEFANNNYLKRQQIQADCSGGLVYGCATLTAGNPYNPSTGNCQTYFTEPPVSGAKAHVCACAEICKWDLSLRCYGITSASECTLAQNQCLNGF